MFSNVAGLRYRAILGKRHWMVLDNTVNQALRNATYLAMAGTRQNCWVTGNVEYWAMSSTWPLRVPQPW